MNECDENHGCDHTCANNNGSYTCTCDLGFALDSDGRNCSGIIRSFYEIILLQTRINEIFYSANVHDIKTLLDLRNYWRGCSTGAKCTPAFLRYKILEYIYICFGCV